MKKSDRVPDSRTYWHFREQLITSGSIESLFSAFNGQLDKCGVLANEGKMVDASFVAVPKQRNNREENNWSKKGKSLRSGRNPRISWHRKIQRPAGPRKTT